MNVLCSFLTIYALLCSNVVVHLSDHNAGAAGASAVVQSDGASARDSDPFASPQPASPSFVASLAKGLGCSNTQVNNDTTTTTTSASASSADDTGSIYRVLAANIERASEWGSATAAACRGDLDR